MPYTYSVAGTRAGAPADVTLADSGSDKRWRSRRTRRVGIVVGALCAAGTTAGLVAALLPSGGAPPAAGAAVRRAFLEANIIEENLGAPAPGTPSAASARAFVTTSHRVVAHGLVAGGAVPTPARALGAADTRAILTGQGAALRARFSGALLAREQRALSSLVADENAGSLGRVGPGGAAIVQWFSVAVNGTSARAEALVARWEQRDRVAATAAGTGFSTRVVRTEIDALATFKLSGGSWRLVSLAEAPWQEPT